MTPGQQKLYNSIDEILWNEWDPISANTHGLPRDEYQCYIPEVYAFKTRNADQESIAKHLLKIETEIIGMPGGVEHCRMVAAKIVALTVNE